MNPVCGGLQCLVDSVCVDARDGVCSAVVELKDSSLYISPPEEGKHSVKMKVNKITKRQRIVIKWMPQVYEFLTFCTFEGTFGRIMLWCMSSVRPSGWPSVCLSVCLSVCPALAKSCPLINFKLISPRLTFLCIVNGHDP